MVLRNNDEFFPMCEQYPATIQTIIAAIIEPDETKLQASLVKAALINILASVNAVLALLVSN